MEKNFIEFKEMFEKLPYEKQIQFIEAFKEMYGINLQENEEMVLNEEQKKGVR